MATVSIVCPGCAKKLRFGKPPEEGKKVKCPACGEAFVPDLDDEHDAEAVGIREKPSRSPVSARRRDRDEVEDDARPARSRRRDDDEDDDDASARSRRRDDDDDDRPSRKKKRKQKAGSPVMLYGLLAAGAFVVIVLCSGLGVTAFVWPGFLRSKQADAGAAVGVAAAKEQPGPPVNLKNFVMADADVVVGFNVKGLRDANQFDVFLNGFRGMTPTGLPRGFEEIARDSDRVVVTMHAAELMAQMGEGPPNAPKGGRPPGGVPKGGPGANAPQRRSPRVIVAVGLTSAEAVGRAKNVLRTVPGMGPEEKIVNKYPAYRYRDPATGEVTTFVFPADRVLVITPSNDQQLLAVLERVGAGTLNSAQLQKMMGTVEQAQVWGAYITDAQGRAALATLSLILLGQAGDMPPAVKQAAQALSKLKGVSLAYDSQAGGGAKMQFHLDCDDVDAARRLKEGGDALKSALIQQVNDPAVSANLRKDYNTLTFAAQGTVTSGSVTLSAETLKQLGDVGKGGNQGLGFGPPAQQGKPQPPKTQSYTINNLNAQATNDRTVNVGVGRKVTVSVTYTAADPNTNVDLYIYQGQAQPNAIPAARDEKPATLQKRPMRTCTATFVAALTEQYTIRVINRGPGPAPVVTVTIREE